MPPDATVVLLCLRNRLDGDLVAEVLLTEGLTPARLRTGETVAAAVRRVRADLVLLDLGTEETIESLERTIVAALAMEARILLVTDSASRPMLLAGLLAGASGHVSLRGTTPEAFVKALGHVVDGSAALHPEVAAAVLQQWRVTRSGERTAEKQIALSAREVQILGGAAEGLTNQAIARRLELSLKTVETHKARIFAKLGARNQAQALSLAIQRGLLPPDGGAPSVNGDAATPP